MKKIKLALVASLAVSSANADFSMSLHFGAMFSDNLATVNLPVGTVGVLVVSTSGSTTFPSGSALSGLSLVDGSDWGSGFKVLTSMAAVNVNVDQDGAGPNPAVPTTSFAQATTHTINTTTGVFSTLTAGNPLGLYWFPGITDTNPIAGTGPANVTPSSVIQPNIAIAQPYGFYRTSIVQNVGMITSNNAFVLAGITGTGVRYQARSDFSLTPTQEASVGSNPNPNDIDFATVFSVPAVPEPSTYAAIFGLVVLGLALHRRQAKKS